MRTVTICDRQSAAPVDSQQLRTIAEAVLDHSGISDAAITIVLVDDPAIHELNRRHLAHDYPTDVLSFVLSDSGAPLEAEIIVSTDTAIREADRFGWDALSEVCLYVVHGVLHACGHDDHAPRRKAAMRRAERAVLKKFGLTPQYAARRAAASRGRRRPLRTTN
jgi:probable rRNA maturation factor